MPSTVLFNARSGHSKKRRPAARARDEFHWNLFRHSCLQHSLPRWYNTRDLRIAGFHRPAVGIGAPRLQVKLTRFHGFFANSRGRAQITPIGVARGLGIARFHRLGSPTPSQAKTTSYVTPVPADILARRLLNVIADDPAPACIL